MVASSCFFGFSPSNFKKIITDSFPPRGEFPLDRASESGVEARRAAQSEYIGDKEHNRVQTVPGKGWNTLLRLYGPLEPWFNTTWRPGEITLQQ